MRHARAGRDDRHRFEDTPSLNDNVPGMLAGHEMSDFAGVPRQPATENSIHYARVSQIEAFPDHPATGGNGVAAVPDIAATADAPVMGTRAKGTKGVIAGIGSLLLHAGLLLALAVGLVVDPQDAVEEAGAVVNVTILGNAEFDEIAAGNPAEDAVPEPEIVAAEQVQPDQVQPIETAQRQPAEVQPLESVAPQSTVATEPVEQIEAEPIATLEPQVLTSAVPAEPIVSQPVAAPQAMEQPPVEMAEVQPLASVEKPIEPEPERPEAKKPPEKPKPKDIDVAKPKEPKRKPKSGNKGEQKQDSKRGNADGEQAAESSRNGSERAGKRSSASGSAAVANYPGKVQAKIRRSVRVPSALKRKHSGVAVRIKLTIGSNGSLSSVGVARSSGVPELDQLVVDGVRRAAPFPPLPAGWGKSTWQFTQEVQITR